MATGPRLDHYLSSKYPEISRGFIQKLINTDQVLVNGQSQKSGYIVKDEDSIKILYDMASIGQVPSIDMPILYENDDILVVNKPAGILSHALSKFHNEPSVASFLRQRLTKEMDADLRFGIAHRLDRLTSGVMVCAKNEKTLKHLQKQFAERLVSKKYTAIVSGQPKLDEAVMDWPIERNPKSPARFRVGPNGKSAQTKYKVIARNVKYAQLELEPLTGRTHQLRVHLKHLGHPIVGDHLYDGEVADRLYLHAHTLEISLPSGKQTFTAPIPQEFNKLIKS